MSERIRLSDPATDIVIRRNARTRRMTLTVPQNGDPPRLSAPDYASGADLARFLERQSEWLRGALKRAPEPVRVEHDARLPVAGVPLRIERREGPRRAPWVEDDRLILQGRGDAGPRVSAWLRERARAALQPIVADCAAAIGATHGRLTLRDTKGRWGSCTSRGDLSFSWRLAMAPPAALDYVAAHEAAHLIEMNHGPRFWALVERLRPDWRRQRDWLRSDGGALHRYRFEAASD